MATYFHGNSEIQADGLQTLYLMNPNYVGYSDTPQQPGNMAVFLNSTENPLNPANLSQTQTQNQHFVGIPLQPPTPTTPSTTSQDPDRPSPHHPQQEISYLPGFIPRVLHNLWSTMDQQMNSAAANNSIGVTDYTSQLSIRRSMVPPPPSQQVLSLSLSAKQSAFGNYRTESDMPAQTSAPVISPKSGEEMRVSGGTSSSASGVSNETSNIQSYFLGSKYLKVAQQLLDEVVNGIMTELSKGNNNSNNNTKDQFKMNRGDQSSSMTGEGSLMGGGESSVRKVIELTTAERQELQMKRAKLVTMLDEVEQRYRQYHHQMQIVVSSFEQAAGFGSAKTYTDLALQTISKQFRCLKDSISEQIRATGKSLGEEEDCINDGGKVQGSRLKFVDHHFQQQRALQQLGMIQNNNAWRPQRGLPERSVSILRAWLFEHFLHPYPKDSDKLMLAKQTGLTRGQVSNWFINARVRLWKPMVEEMYMEEVKDQEQNGLEQDKTCNNKNKLNEEYLAGSKYIDKNNPHHRTDEQTKSTFGSKQDKPTDSNVRATTISNNLSVPTTNMEENISAQAAGFLLVGSLDSSEGILQGNSKKSRNIDDDDDDQLQNMEMKPEPVGETKREQLCMNFGNNESENRNGYSLITLDGSNHGGGGFDEAYHHHHHHQIMGENIGGRFDTDDQEQFGMPAAGVRFSNINNGVSLTLGLPHCENISSSSSGAQQSYNIDELGLMRRRVENIRAGKEGAANDYLCGINYNKYSTTYYLS